MDAAGVIRYSPETYCIRGPAEVWQFIENLRGAVLYLPAYLTALMGVCLGEIAGLQWRDMDLVNGGQQVAPLAVRSGREKILGYGTAQEQALTRHD